MTENSFNVIIPLSKGLNDSELIGIASTTSIDRDSERMSDNALKMMVKDIKTLGVNLFGNHEHNWENTLGVIKDADLTTQGVAVKINLDDSTTNPKIPMLINKLKRGIKLGLSVGGNVIGYKDEYNKAEGKKVKVLDKVQIYEVSVVGIPSNADAFVSLPDAISKSAKLKKRKTSPTDDAIMEDFSRQEQSKAESAGQDWADEGYSKEEVARILARDFNITDNQATKIARGLIYITSSERKSCPICFSKVILPIPFYKSSDLNDITDGAVNSGKTLAQIKRELKGEYSEEDIEDSYNDSIMFREARERHKYCPICFSKDFRQECRGCGYSEQNQFIPEEEVQKSIKGGNNMANQNVTKEAEDVQQIKIGDRIDYQGISGTVMDIADKVKVKFDNGDFAFFDKSEIIQFIVDTRQKAIDPNKRWTCPNCGKKNTLNDSECTGCGTDGEFVETDKSISKAFRIGDRVTTPDGKGKITEIIDDWITVVLEGGESHDYDERDLSKSISKACKTSIQEREEKAKAKYLKLKEKNKLKAPEGEQRYMEEECKSADPLAQKGKHNPICPGCGEELEEPSESEYKDGQWWHPACQTQKDYTQKSELKFADHQTALDAKEILDEEGMAAHVVGNNLVVGDKSEAIYILTQAGMSGLSGQ